MNPTKQDDLDDVINALNVDNIPSPPKIERSSTFSKEEALNVLIDELYATLERNAAVLEEAKRLVEAAGDPEYIEAYASASKGQSETIKQLSNLLIEKEKLEQQRELKTRDLDLKEKALANKNTAIESLPPGSVLNQTNILMNGTRDEMFDLLFGSPEEREKILRKNITPLLEI